MAINEKPVVAPAPFPEQVTEVAAADNHDLGTGSKIYSLPKVGYETAVQRSTTTLPVAEAEHRRQIQRWTAATLLLLLITASGVALYLLVELARNGTPDGQKLAFGVIGTVLGVLWTNYAKLVDSVTKR